MNLWMRLGRALVGARWSRRTDLWATDVTVHRVLPTDLDLNGHLTNSRYLALTDVARLDLMARAGVLRECLRRGYFPVVTRTTITFSQSLRLWQRFEVHTRVHAITEKAVYVEHFVMADGRERAHAMVASRFLKRTGGSVTPEEIRAMVGDFPSTVSSEAPTLTW
jgi:acyl-CoA thioesterase FadM